LAIVFSIFSGIYVFFKEIVYLILTVFLAPFSFFSWDWRSKGTSTPVLLVHGYFNFASVWLFLAPRLFKRLNRSIYTLNLGNPLKPIEHYAKRVKEKVDQIEKETGSRQVILVGHSMGGLVSLCYSLFIDKKDTVEKVVTLGSPLKGTIMARIGVGACARQMQRGSDFLKKLKQEYDNTSINAYHLVTKKDELVIPYTSGLLSKDETRHCTLDHMGHIELLYSKKIEDQVVYWIMSV